MGQLFTAFAHYDEPTFIQPTFWGPAMEVTLYGLPCVAILAFLCVILLSNRKLLIEYQNTITFITFGCFFTATPIVWFNVMVFIGMEITGGHFKFTLFWCTFFKVSTLSLWFCSFVVPSVVALNRYLLLVHNKQTNWWFSCRALFLLYLPMVIIDILVFFIGEPSANDTCATWLYVNLTPIPQLYNLYVFLVSGSGVLMGWLTLSRLKRILSKGTRVNDRQLARVIYVQAWVPFLATTFFVIHNLGTITNMYTVPIWFSRPANIYAVIGTTLFIPLIALSMAGKIRRAALTSLGLERFASSEASRSGGIEENGPAVVNITRSTASTIPLVT